MNVPNKTKGFTIIEVVLVLAIAGLIFLVVFLALPALQRGQRDSQRKTDIGKFMSQVTSYQSNNQGNLPSSAANSTTQWNSFIGSYLRTGGTPFADPDGQDYTASVVATTAPSSKPTPASGNIEIYIGFRCDAAATSGVAGASGNRNIAVFVKQEQGGTYCQSN